MKLKGKPNKKEIAIACLCCIAIDVLCTLKWNNRYKACGITVKPLSPLFSPTSKSSKIERKVRL